MELSWRLDSSIDYSVVPTGGLILEEEGGKDGAGKYVEIEVEMKVEMEMGEVEMEVD